MNGVKSFFFLAVFFPRFLLSRCVTSLARLANTLSLPTYGSLFQLRSNVTEEWTGDCDVRKNSRKPRSRISEQTINLWDTVSDTTDGMDAAHAVFTGRSHDENATAKLAVPETVMPRRFRSS